MSAATAYQARCGWPGRYERFTAYGPQRSRPCHAAEFLREPLQRCGTYASDLPGLLADLAAGHVLVLDNGAVFQVVPESPQMNATLRELLALRRIDDGLIAATAGAASHGRTGFHFTDIDGERHSCGVVARALWSAGYVNLVAGEPVLTGMGRLLLRQHWTPNMENDYVHRYRYVNLPG